MLRAVPFVSRRYLGATLSANAYSAPPSTVAIIVFYNVIQCMNAIFFARRCFIATGRSKWVAGLLVVVVGGLVIVSSAVCVLNICVFVGGKSYIVVSTPTNLQYSLS